MYFFGSIFEGLPEKGEGDEESKKLLSIIKTRLGDSLRKPYVAKVGSWNFYMLSIFNFYEDIECGRYEIAYSVLRELNKNIDIRSSGVMEVIYKTLYELIER